MNTNSMFRAEGPAKVIALYPNQKNGQSKERFLVISLNKDDQNGSKPGKRFQDGENLEIVSRWNTGVHIPMTLCQSDFIERIRELIEEHMDFEEYSIDSLCRDAGTSRSNLHKKLKRLTGLSTSMFIRAIKLQRAKEFLKNTDMGVWQIAYATGFSDPNYFSRVFTKAFSLSPKAFRDSVSRISLVS